MKKAIVAVSVLALITSSGHFVPAQAGPVPTKKEVRNMTEEEKSARLNAIEKRVNEIKEMDFSTLSSTEKKALKKELKEAKKEAQAVRGVYLSIGAIIIIILLLILIL